MDIVDPTYSRDHVPDRTTSADSRSTRSRTPSSPTSRITGAQQSGDAYDAKSGFGIWANELPEAGQGPAVGSVTFNNLTLSDNHENIQNTTSTFTINVNP